MKEIYISTNINEQTYQEIENYLNYLKDCEGHWKDRQFKLTPYPFTLVPEKDCSEDQQLESALFQITHGE